MATSTAEKQEPAGVLRVVLMDDTPDIRLLVRVALEANGQFEIVGEADDGRAGVDLVRRTRPDLALVDLSMPVMDGFQALAQIQRDVPSSRVIMLSSYDAAEMADRAIESGALAYVQKGSSAKKIVTDVCAALGIAEAAPADRNLTLVESPPAMSVELDRMQAALAGAAHELRGPATVLVAMAELLSSERDSLDAGTFNSMLDAISRQAHVLERVTGDLLTSTQSQRGVLTVEAGEIALRAALEQAAIGTSERMPVTIACDPDIAVVADATRLQQMLGNLVSNASKYGAAPIELEAHVDGATARVRVVDHGAGVPEQFRSRLFDQFSRAEGTQVNGMGLGLFVVRSLAQAQGGSAWYEPVATGGAAFCFTLPLVVTPESATED